MDLYLLSPGTTMGYNFLGQIQLTVEYKEYPAQINEVLCSP